MTRWIASLVAVFVAVFALAQFAPAPRQEAVAGEVLVKFRNGVTVAQRERVRQRLSARLIPSVAGPGIYKFIGSLRWDVFAVAASLRKDPTIAFAEPNGVVHACYPNDPSYGNQWGYSRINWLAGMNLYKGNSGIVIAVIDSGVQLDHPDLAAKIVAGWNFIGNNAIPNDDYHHGTHVAGIAAAITDNGVGVAGTCPLCSIMPVKVLDYKGTGTWENVAAGINWAADNGAHVINLSLGGGDGSSVVQQAVTHAASLGVVTAAAAGNNTSSTPFYPAAYPEAIAVASTTTSNQKAWFTDYNSGQNQWVDVAAPGISIYSTLIGSTYGYDEGTSMSSPFVAGEAALVYGALTEGTAPPSRSTVIASRVRQIMESTCVYLGDWVTKGRIDIGAALAQATQAAVTGNVQLEAFRFPATVPITVQLMTPGTTNVVETATVNLDVDGNFAATLSSAGTFDFRFSAAARFLARRALNVAVSRMSATAAPQVYLPNGDANSDGRVSTLDLAAVLANFNQGPSIGDLNGDGNTTVLDLAAVLMSFGLTSDP